MLFTVGCRLVSVVAPTQRRLNLALSLVLVAGVGVGCGGGEPQGELPPVEDLANVQQASVSCEQWTDTGYVDGAPFEITLVTIDGKPAEISTANAYVVMQTAAAADGVNISVVSGFRTYAEQQYFYNCYVNCNCNNCNLAAKPGYSNHQSGHALDLNTSTGSVLSWLNAHGATYGFSRTVPSEAWHWEWWGGGPGGGPCNDTTPGTPCTVDTTGKSGECMDTSACAALGNHESTPGYCPGPNNIQCCTATSPPVVDAAVEDATQAPDADAEVVPDAGAAKDAGVNADAAPATDAGSVKDAGAGKDGSAAADAGLTKDAGGTSETGSTNDGGVFFTKDAGSTGGCSMTSKGGARESSQGPFAALFAGLLIGRTARRLRRRLR